MATVDIRVARRYAAALFATAQKTESLARVQNDLGELQSLCDTHVSFQKMWFSPRIPVGQKKQLSSDLFKTSVDPVTLAFLGLLIDKRREDILPVISTEVRRLADAEKNLIRAHATFAVTPTTAECDDLKASLEKRTGKSIQLTHEVNDEIIGGVVVRMHDNIIDGSVRGSLEKMRVSLLQEA